MAHGASGYMVKDDAPDQLVLAIKTILRGKKYISPSVTTMLTDRELRSLDQAVPSLEILTKREKQIFAMIAQSMPNKNIATKLKISIRTVEHHRANLTDKLGFKDATSLVKYAMAKGLA
jgi:DNA-binding NarL/FixJ family response regulator